MDKLTEYRKVERALHSVQMAIMELSQLQGYEYSLKNLNILESHLNNELVILYCETETV